MLKKLVTYTRLLASTLLIGVLCGANSAVAALPEPIATFSVAAYDPATGEVGVAVQSKFFCVGSVVPWARAGVGAVATQAFGNTTFGPLGLDQLEAGSSPSQVLHNLLANDDKATQRQVGIVLADTVTAGDTSTPTTAGAWANMSSLNGMAASYTGSECLAWAGGATGQTTDGLVYAIQGNILTGPEVVDAMVAAFEQPAEDFAQRLVNTVVAGQAAGGDSRGMQSAALLVCQEGAGYGGYNDIKYDLRVDDAVDPFAELQRLLELGRPIVLSNEAYIMLNDGRMEQALVLFERLVQLEPENAYHHYNLACGYSRSGRIDEGLAELRIAVELDPKLSGPAQGDTDLTPLSANPEFFAILGIPPDLPPGQM